MVAKCANPACCAPFRYLHLGRVFKIELHPRGSDDSGYGDRRASTVEHYWLCHVCSSSLTLTLEAGKVITRPLRPTPPVADFSGPRAAKAPRAARRTSAVSFQQNESVVG
jgi:hypothetical protein